jgi:hypothetical protein
MGESLFIMTSTEMQKNGREFVHNDEYRVAEEWERVCS